MKKQGVRDENIKALASSMRDMLASLSEIKDLEKIKILQSVITDAMTRIHDCAEFIQAYAQHGFWGESSSSCDCRRGLGGLGRLVRQSLSSYTADTIQMFRGDFSQLEAKFNNSVAIQTLITTVESHQLVGVLKDDIKAILVAQSDRAAQGKGSRFGSICPCALTCATELLESKLPRSKDAAYDRGVRCLPGTRQDILGKIYDWIDSKEPSNNVFWLRGAAGSGKSTIASTVAAELDNENSRLRQLSLGSIGATFFCKRGVNTLDQPRLVFPTLAFGLASTCPLIREHIILALTTNPDIGESPSIVNQFHELIVGPLSKIPKDLVVAPVVTIIDAIDECGDESTRERLLQCLEEIRYLPFWFKLLITSRPEPDIAASLCRIPSGHEVDTWSEQSVSDIKAYTQACLAGLRAKRGLGSEWPGDEKVRQLCSRAEGLFIWTTLSFRFVSRALSPTKALDLVLTPTTQSHMDTLYHTVLVQGRENEDELALIRSILGFVVVSRRPLTLRSVCALLNIDEEEAKWARDKLASVLPTGSRSILRVIHPSFLDFLTDRKRSREFFIDIDEHNVSLARGVLQQMNDRLRVNICRLTAQTIQNDKLCDLASRLEEHVPEELAYSCQFWSEHLERAFDQEPELLPLLHEFCDEHMLHWMEVMSLQAETRRAIMAVRNVQKWLPVSVVNYLYLPQRQPIDLILYLQPDDPCMGILRDVTRFWGSFGYVATQSAPSIYVSAAVFIPQESHIAKLARREFRVPPTLRTTTEILWDPALLTLSGHVQGVGSVAFSPDGKKIVSGSYDKTLRVWDAESGSSILGPLVGHTDWVTSVAFSPDGKKIVSGSHDQMLRVWDAESGSSILGPLVGHTDLVMSVAFSPDGKKIVSGSYDQTLRVWDAESGSSILGPLVRHTDLVRSVAFSPDGKKIVSGSYDKTLRVWDAESGSSILGPLVGHTDLVTSVAFSPDGKKIVSGSYDQTLRVWDAESGSSILGPLVGHTDLVTSVAFSPDGKKIVSGSYGKTLRVWDAESGSSILGPLVGHTDAVMSVAFSPDGKKIVSGSYDKTLRVWDAESGSIIVGPLVGHTSFVTSVAFPPDGRSCRA